MALILIVDSNPHLRTTLQGFLEAAGHDVLLAEDGTTALALMPVYEVALILTDMLLPEMDGLAFCQAIRRQYNVPLIILSVLDQPETIACALDAGADDYLTKPFDFQVLAAHIDGLLRRVTWLAEPRQFPTTHNHEIVLCPDQPEVLVRGHVVKLRPVEYRLLRYLMIQADCTVSTETLYEAIWGHRLRHKASLVHTTIFRLRQKLEENPQSPRHIVTVNSGGYRFCTIEHPDERTNTNRHIEQPGHVSRDSGIAPQCDNRQLVRKYTPEADLRRCQGLRDCHEITCCDKCNPNSELSPNEYPHPQ